RTISSCPQAERWARVGTDHPCDRREGNAGKGNKMRFCCCCTGMILALIACDAHAEQAQMRQAKVREQAWLGRQAENFKKSCQSDITVEFDWSAVPEANLARSDPYPDDLPPAVRRWIERARIEGTQFPHERCQQVLTGIEQVCEDGAGKDAVRTHIKRVICGFAAKRSVSLKDAVLDYKVDFDPNGGDRKTVFEYLQENLSDAHGQSLKIRQAKMQDEAWLVRSAERLNKRCQSAITVAFDWSAVPETYLDPGGPSVGFARGRAGRDTPHYRCNRVLEGVEQVCEDRAGRDAVRAQIRRIICGFAAERAVSLKDGVLDFRIDFDVSKREPWIVLEYLQGNL